MALNIKTTGESVGITTWYVGQPAPDPFFLMREVEMIQADGDELQKILTEIDGIPKANLPSLLWFGDDAKFIVANLDYQKRN